MREKIVYSIYVVVLTLLKFFARFRKKSEKNVELEVHSEEKHTIYKEEYKEIDFSNKNEI